MQTNKVVHHWCKRQRNSYNSGKHLYSNTRPKLHYCLSLEWTSLCASITAALYPTTLGMWKSMCIYCVCVCWGVSRRVVSCTARCVTLGNLRNFHLRGVGTLKREHRFPLSRKRTTRCFGPRCHHYHTAEVATLTWPLWVYCTAGCVCNDRHMHVERETEEQRVRLRNVCLSLRYVLVWHIIVLLLKFFN